MKGVIVSNATPIIAFSRISKLDLFRQIIGEITIPQEVSKELYEHGRTDVPALNRSNWIKTKKVKSHADVELLLPSLDKGEAEVIVLSKELGAGLVIIDELTARKVAIMMGLPVIGAVGLLIHAKKTGLIKEVKPLLDDMIRHGIRYKENFYKEVLKSIKPKLSDFLLDLHRSLAHKGFAKILDISTGMPAVFANPYASRSQHISSQKIAQLRLKSYGDRGRCQIIRINHGGKPEVGGRKSGRDRRQRTA